MGRKLKAHNRRPFVFIRVHSWLIPLRRRITPWPHYSMMDKVELNYQRAYVHLAAPSFDCFGPMLRM
jgi:hypothetical protein